MTDPLTPPDCDLSDFAFMPLQVARLRDSELASNETPEACWAAVLLWAAAWHQIPAGSIPNDDKWLAKAAGYGRVVKEWLKVKDGAMRGFIECTDGRFYHPVVSEKACQAWTAKLRQRWGTECARIKKHNERHHTSIEKPTFEAWLAAGRPAGHPLHVPGDKPPGPDPVTGDSASKGQGEGQGDSSSEAIASGGAGAPPPVDKSTKPETPLPTKREALNLCGSWLLANGVTEAVARDVMGKLLKDHPGVAVEALAQAPKQAVTPNPVAWLVATAKGIEEERAKAGKRQHPTPTADETAADLRRRELERQATETPEARAAAEAARARAMAARDALAQKAETAGAPA